MSPLIEDAEQLCGLTSTTIMLIISSLKAHFIGLRHPQHYIISFDFCLHNTIHKTTQILASYPGLQPLVTGNQSDFIWPRPTGMCHLSHTMASQRSLFTTSNKKMFQRLLFLSFKMVAGPLAPVSDIQKSYRRIHQIFDAVCFAVNNFC